jgi:hypothetical protein
VKPRRRRPAHAHAHAQAPHTRAEQHKMGKAKKTRKFAEVKRMLNPKDAQ